MVQVPWALYPLHHLPVNQSLDPPLGVRADHSETTRRRCPHQGIFQGHRPTEATSMPTGERVPLPPEAKPTILLLYAGKDDAGSLDSYLHAT